MRQPVNAAERVGGHTLSGHTSGNWYRFAWVSGKLNESFKLARRRIANYSESLSGVSVVRSGVGARIGSVGTVFGLGGEAAKETRAVGKIWWCGRVWEGAIRLMWFVKTSS
ncbi:hypothetical protein RRSWK_02688 [Rhodopirellula sp. SWK7]|nr:hypothetical protein RRSWK_02688 [Rhodopirellula sp. SWK7]